MFDQPLDVFVYMTMAYFVLILYFFIVMVQTDYWSSPATPAKKSYNRGVSSVKKVIFLPNIVILWRIDIVSEFIGGGRGGGGWST